MDYIAWLRMGLAKPGKTQRGLADAIGVDATAVSKMLKGKRRLQVYEMTKAAAYLQIPELGRETNSAKRVVATHQRTTQIVPLLKIAAGGVWREEGVPMVLEAVAIPVVPDSRLEGLRQYATRIEGIDFDKILRPGDYAIFVPFGDMRDAPLDGDIVEIERHKAGVIETTVRRVRIKGGVVEFWPESTDPAWREPVRMTSGPRGHRTEITGLFVGLFRPHKF